jgi:uncharacterized protein (TIGR03083 family)
VNGVPLTTRVGEGGWYGRRVQLSPRYEGPVVLTMDRVVPDPALAVTRQRRRLEGLLADLSADDWAAPSRCEGWTVRDVVVHLVTVNQFWEASVRAGREGAPTRMLASFDPAAHPPMLVASVGDIGPDQVLEQFVASNDGFLGQLAELSGDDWDLLAESPAGHVAITHIADHGLWDAWIHERDIALPLGFVPDEEPDELHSALRYAAAIGPGLAAGRPGAFTGTLAVAASEPDIAFTVEAGITVAIHEEPASADLPVLRGRAADLVDALSVRSDLPADAPDEWRHLVQGLVDAFSTP